MKTFKLPGSPRSYEILKPNAKIKLAGSWCRVDQISRKYKPVVEQDPTLGEPPVCIKYEIVDGAAELKIRYHVIWNDETHPIRLVDLLYSEFRDLYYGARIDSEKIEVLVAKATGDISGVLFETERSGGRGIVPAHAIATLCQDNGNYVLSVGGQRYYVDPDLIQKRMRFKVETWNHEFSVLCQENARLISYDLPITNLSDSDYVTFRYSARCATTDAPWQSKVIQRILTVAWFACAPVILILAIRRAVRS